MGERSVSSWSRTIGGRGSRVTLGMRPRRCSFVASRGVRGKGHRPSILQTVRGLSSLWVVLVAAGACDPGPVPTAVDAGLPAELAASDPGAARAPPPVRVPRAAVPALPDLPSLSAHEAAATASAGAGPRTAIRATRCGPAARPRPWPVRAAALFFDRSGSAVPVVPRRLLAHDPAVLPAVVDHRLEGTEGPVRNQGNAPACTAFATAAAHRPRARALGRGQSVGQRHADLVALPLAGGGDLAHRQRRAEARTGAAVAVQRPRGRRLGALRGLLAARRTRGAGRRSTRRACAPWRRR